MDFTISMNEIPTLLSCLSARMAEGAMGISPMPPEGIMDRLLQNSLTREDLLLFQELLLAAKEERDTISENDANLKQGIGILNETSDSLLARVEKALIEKP